ncbi:hypothetical protein ACVIQY_002117 [Bradyrhizobium sp. USDA 3051]
MAVDDRLECIGDVGGRIDVVELAGGDDRREQGPVLRADFMTGEGAFFLVRQTGRMAFSTGFVSSSRRPSLRKRVSPCQ